MTTLQTREHVPSITRGGGMATYRPGPPRATPAAGLTGRDIMRILRRRKWLIILSVVIFTAIAAVATMLWLRFAPRYTARAYIGVTAGVGRVLSESDRMARGGDVAIVKMSHVRMATRQSVLIRAVREDVDSEGRRLDRIRKTQYYKRDQVNIIERLRGDLSITSIPKTNLIQIALTGTNPRELPEIVNPVAVALVAEVRGSATRDRTGQIADLEAERERLVGEQNVNLKSIETLRGASEVPMMQERRNILQLKLQTLSAELTQLGLAKAQTEAALKATIDQERDGTLASSPEVLRALDMDPTVRALRTAVQNMQIELETLSDRLGPEHRRVAQTRSRLANVKNGLAAKEKELIGLQIEAMKQMRQAGMVAVTERLFEVRSQYNEAVALARDLAVQLGRIGQYSARNTLLRENIRSVRNALLRFRLALKGESPMILRGLAEEPKEPSMPKWEIMMPLGIFLGLAVGLGLAFLLELIDTSIKSPSDISRRVDLPLLGMVPHLDDLDEEIEDIRTALLAHPDSLIGEAFRQVRTCLLFSGPASQRRSLMITSPSPGDGRTTVAINLAAAVAGGGRKVLVVDANFRQPAIGQLFPPAPDGGLSSALVGRAVWTDLVHQVQENLYVMAAGPLPPSPAELLGSEQMRTIIGEMTSQYDQVIFDAAPVLVVSDPGVLSTLVDGVIVVVRAGTNTYGIVQRTRDVLLRVGAHLIGAVLNGVRVTAGGYLRKNYDTFYEYQGERGAQPRLPAETPK